MLMKLTVAQGTHSEHTTWKACTWVSCVAQVGFEYCQKETNQKSEGLGIYSSLLTNNSVWVKGYTDKGGGLNATPPLMAVPQRVKLN